MCPVTLQNTHTNWWINFFRYSLLNNSVIPHGRTKMSHSTAKTFIAENTPLFEYCVYFEQLVCKEKPECARFFDTTLILFQQHCNWSSSTSFVKNCKTHNFVGVFAPRNRQTVAGVEGFFKSSQTQVAQWSPP